MKAFRRGDQGASAIEFALVLTPLILLLTGILAFGFGFARWVALTNGAREGARYMAINSSVNPGGAAAEAETRALQWAGLACDDGCTFSSTACTSGTENATFAITMPRFSPFDIVPGIDLSFPMTSEAVMQCGG
jgi:Flp pilus assembly protein TadG